MRSRDRYRECANRSADLSSGGKIIVYISGGAGRVRGGNEGGEDLKVEEGVKERLGEQRGSKRGRPREAGIHVGPQGRLNDHAEPVRWYSETSHGSRSERCFSTKHKLCKSPYRSHFISMYSFPCSSVWPTGKLHVFIERR